MSYTTQLYININLAFCDMQRFAMTSEQHSHFSSFAKCTKSEWRIAILLYQPYGEIRKYEKYDRGALRYHCQFGLLRYATICDDLQMAFAYFAFCEKYEIRMAKYEFIILAVWRNTKMRKIRQGSPQISTSIWPFAICDDLR